MSALLLTEKTYSISEAARIAGCGKSMMYWYVDTEQIKPVRRFGKRKRIPETALVEFIKFHTARDVQDEVRIRKAEAKARNQA